MIVAGVDPGQVDYNIALVSPGGILTFKDQPLHGAVKAIVAGGADLVIIERPGRGNQPNVAPSLCKVFCAISELVEALPLSIQARTATCDNIRAATMGLTKAARGNHDEMIKHWLRTIHLPGERKLGPDEVRRMFSPGIGPLSTADRRDAYLAALYGGLVR